MSTIPASVLGPNDSPNTTMPSTAAMSGLTASSKAARSELMPRCAIGWNAKPKHVHMTTRIARYPHASGVCGRTGASNSGTNTMAVFSRNATVDEAVSVRDTSSKPITMKNSAPSTTP